jgi:integrase/recombinase XerD
MAGTQPMHAALAVLLGFNGLRVSEACGTNIEDLGFERGHRILRIVGKGNKPAVIPLVPRTARTVDLAIGERSQGPILLRHNGERVDTRTAYRWVRSVGARAGLDRASRTRRSRLGVDRLIDWLPPPWPPVASAR